MTWAPAPAAPAPVAAAPQPATRPGLVTRAWRRSRWTKRRDPVTRVKVTALVPLAYAVPEFLFRMTVGLVFTLAWMALREVLRRAASIVLHVAWEATRGRARAMYAPMWLGLAAALPVPSPVLAWLAASLTALTYTCLSAFLGAALPPRTERPRAFQWVTPRRRVLSARERAIGVDALALVAAWHTVTPGLPWWARALALPVFLAWPSTAWWASRRPKPTPEIVRVWVEDDRAVAREFPMLDGTPRDITPDGKGMVLTLHHGLASEASRMDEEVEAYIDRTFPEINLHRGSLNIAMDPKLGVRDIRVNLTRTPHDDAKVIRYFDGPTLREDGSFIAGYTIHGVPVMGRLWRPGGAAFALLLGGPGSGKGGGTRAYGLEAAMSPHVFTVALDCKGVEEGGSGIPELRTGMDLYLRLRAEWPIGVEMQYAVLTSRSARYGKAGISRWRPDRDPLFALIIDEIQRLADAHPGLAGKMETCTALCRSFGGAQIVNTQRGAGESLYSTTYRSNLRGNGSSYIGAQGDSTAALLASQTYQVDITRLPREPGYMFPLSPIDPDVDPTIPMRFRYSVSADEVAEGIDPGPGTVEQWLTPEHVRHARLCDDDIEALIPWVEKVGYRFNTAGLLEPCDPLVTEPATGGDDEPEQSETDAADSKARALAVLPDVGSVGVEVVAEAAGVRQRRAYQILTELEAKRQAVKVAPGQWRKAS